MEQKRLKLYLETSVVSMYFQEEAPYLRDLTRQFWNDILPYFEVYVSEIVLDEIKATAKMGIRKSLEDLIKDFEILEVNKEIIKLANIYLSHRRLPRGDALHIACASLGNMNFLATWNLRHLYKRGTQEMVREVNTRLKIPIPTIVTPEDFFGEEV